MYGGSGALCSEAGKQKDSSCAKKIIQLGKLEENNPVLLLFRKQNIWCSFALGYISVIAEDKFQRPINRI